jgi:hypothetical protein
MLASVASIVQSGGLGQGALRIIHMHVKAAHDVGMVAAATGGRVRRGAVAKTEAVAGVAAEGSDAAKEDAVTVEEELDRGSESDEGSGAGSDAEPNADELAWLDSVISDNEDEFPEDESPTVSKLAAEFQAGGEIARLMRPTATGGAEAAVGAAAGGAAEAAPVAES